jgi:hypothetical protein
VRGRLLPLYTRERTSFPDCKTLQKPQAVVPAVALISHVMIELTVKCP